MKYYGLVNINYGEIDFFWVWVESEGKFVLDYIGYLVEMGLGLGNIVNLIGFGVGYGGMGGVFLGRVVWWCYMVLYIK